MLRRRAREAPFDELHEVELAAAGLVELPHEAAVLGGVPVDLRRVDAAFEAEEVAGPGAFLRCGGGGLAGEGGAVRRLGVETCEVIAEKRVGEVLAAVGAGVPAEDCSALEELRGKAFQVGMHTRADEALEGGEDYSCGGVKGLVVRGCGFRGVEDEGVGHGDE